MAKQASIEQEGIIIESLSNAMFRVELENGHVVTAHISGKMRLHYIKLLPRPKFSITWSPQYHEPTKSIFGRHSSIISSESSLLQEKESIRNSNRVNFLIFKVTNSERIYLNKFFIKKRF